MQTIFYLVPKRDLKWPTKKTPKTILQNQVGAINGRRRISDLGQSYQRGHECGVQCPAGCRDKYPSERQVLSDRGSGKAARPTWAKVTFCFDPPSRYQRGKVDCLSLCPFSPFPPPETLLSHWVVRGVDRKASTA